MWDDEADYWDAHGYDPSDLEDLEEDPEAFDQDLWELEQIEKSLM